MASALENHSKGLYKTLKTRLKNTKKDQNKANKELNEKNRETVVTVVYTSTFSLLLFTQFGIRMTSLH